MKFLAILSLAFSLSLVSCKQRSASPTVEAQQNDKGATRSEAGNRTALDSTATAKWTDKNFIACNVDPKKKDIGLYWKDDKGRPLRSIQNLRQWLTTKNKKLVFAMNGGMYMEDTKPVGLFIQEGKTIRPLNTRSATGNFYMKPNGVFYIDADNNPAVCTTEQFINTGKIKYATQSGPMLLIDGKIHPAFTPGSKNVNIRNGVGILPDNTTVFAMSAGFINFYDFAEYFKNLGCKYALYLDGFVCQTYLPEKKWMQLGGNFGVMIGVTE